MTFNIGNQNAGIINNVDGDQHVHGVQVGSAHVAQGLAAVEALRAVAEGLPGVAGDPVAMRELGQLEQAVRDDGTGAAGAAPILERLARRLSAIGAFAGAGTALVEPIRALAAWLGPAAQSVLSVLGG